MKLRAVLLLALSLLGVSPAPAPLVVGTVRDARGAPIDGAAVVLHDRAGRTARTTTAPDGTFAVELAGAVEATVTCEFCRPLTIAVDADGRVLAVVERYDAVASSGPSREDARHVPVEGAASLLALSPYVALERTSSLLPGPQVSDRGLSRGGGLAVIDGVPSYDVVSELSPYYAIPAQYAGDVHALPAQSAYVYDDSAGGGTFFVDPTPSAAVTAGSAAGAQAAVALPSALAAAAFSSFDGSHIARASLGGQTNVRGATATYGVSSASGVVDRDANSVDLDTSAARVALASTGRVDARASAWIDRGEYSTDGVGPYVAAAWSDAALQLSARSRAPIAPFADLSFAHRTGWWAGLSSFGATLDESRADAGVTARTRTLDAIVEAGVTRAAFHSGGSTTYDVHDALVSLDLHPSPHWSVEGSLGTGYRVPTLLVEYNSPLLPDDSYTNRDRTLEATAWYTDRSRVRIGATIASRRTAGLDEGTTTAAGLSVAWQVTPELALRAWSMHVAPDLFAKPAARFGALPVAQTPGVVWLTWAHRAMRVDVLWRRDSLDRRPANHLDAAISGPLAPGVEWFVSTLRTLRGTGLETGLRF